MLAWAQNKIGSCASSRGGWGGGGVFVGIGARNLLNWAFSDIIKCQSIYKNSVGGLHMKKNEIEENMKNARTIIFQFAKFSAVGLTCFAVDYGLLIILTEFTSLEYFSSSAISFIVSTLINYVLSMRFVFSGKEGMNRWAELLIFVALSVIGLGLNQMIMWIVVEEMKIFYLFAKIISSIIVSVFNFISRKVFLE